MVDPSGPLLLTPNCVFWKNKTKKHSPNLSCFEIESTFWKRTKFWKWKVIQKPILKMKTWTFWKWKDIVKNDHILKIWIRLTPQDLYCRPQMYYRCVFPDSRKRANDHSALKQAQTSNWSESIFHRKENRKPNCANRLMVPFIGFATYSTRYINQNR